MFDALVPVEIVLGNGTIYVRQIGTTEFRKIWRGFNKDSWFVFWDEAEEFTRRQWEDIKTYACACKEEVYILKYERIPLYNDDSFVAVLTRDVRLRYNGDVYAAGVSQKPSTYD